MGTDSEARRPRSVRLSDAEVELFRLWAEETGLTGQRAGVSNVMRDLAVEAVQVLLEREGVDFDPVEVPHSVLRGTDFRRMRHSRVDQPPPLEPPAWLKELRGELARVGGNLNQAQRSINRGQAPSTPELLEILQDVQEWQGDFRHRLTDWQEVARYFMNKDQA